MQNTVTAVTLLPHQEKHGLCETEYAKGKPLSRYQFKFATLLGPSSLRLAGENPMTIPLPLHKSLI